MFLGTPVDEFATEANKLSEVVLNLKTAFQNAVNPDLLAQDLLGLQGIAIKLQRSLGGVVIDSEKFKETMFDTFEKTISIGSNMTDVKETIEGMASSMGRMVSYSSDSLVGMIEFAKATGMAEKDVGGMVMELVRFGGTILQNVKKMHDLSVIARKSGLDAKTFTTEVGKNMKIASGFGFKSGIDGVTKMVKQASMLRTTMDSIDAKGFANDILDPEKAMEAAAKMQMLGGAVGKLSDPFQLLHMAQTDMAGLQEEMVNATKSSFAFNKETGGFEASTQDLYRLREMAKITGQNFDEMLESGKEAAKLDFLKKNFGIENMSEDDQNIIAGLTQIGKSGGVEVNIPGFKKLEANSAKELEAQLKQTGVQEALKKYQDAADDTEKDIAIRQMSITENQAKDVTAIRYMILTSMDAEKRKNTTQALDTGTDSLIQAYKGAGNIVKEPVVEGINQGVTQVNNTAQKVKKYYGIDPDNTVIRDQRKNELKNLIKQAATGVPTKSGELETDNVQVTDVQDILFSPSSAPTLMSEGTIYKGIVGDEVAFGTGLTEAFNKTGQINQVMSQIMSASQQGSEISGNQNLTTLLNGMSSKLSESPEQGSSTVDGKIDININLNGSISGDNGNLEKVFSDPRVQKQIMDTVLYKLKGYTQKQGVLSNNS